MLQFIRNQSRILLTLLLILIGLSFIVFYNIPTIERMRRDDLGRIRGHAVTIEDLRSARQAAEFMLNLQFQGRLPVGGEFSHLLDQQAWQRLLILGAAERLGISATDAQVKDHIAKLLTADGNLTREQWTAFIGNFLTPLNITEQRFEEIIREGIVIDNVLHAVASPAHAGETEIRDAFVRSYGGVQISVIRLTAADYLSKASITTQEIEDQYKKHPEEPAYHTPLQRKVAYAAFPVPPAIAKLPDKDKAEARHKIEEKAIELGLALLDRKDLDVDGFKTAATQAGATSGETDYFSRDQAPAGLPPSPGFNRAAFQLSATERLSDRVETDGAYYILFFAGEKASELLPLDQVRGAIEKELKEQKTRDLLQQDGIRLAGELQAAVAAGKSFAAAAAERKLKATPLPAFIPATASADTFKDETETIFSVIRKLEPGQVGGFEPTPGGGLIASFDQRTPPDEAEFAKVQKEIRSQIEERLRSQIINAWLHQESTAPDTVTPKQFQSDDSSL